MNNSDNLIANKINDILKDKITLSNLYHNKAMRDLCNSFFYNLHSICLFDNHVRVLNLCTCFYLYLNEENRIYQEKIDELERSLNKLMHKNNELIITFLNNLHIASIYDLESTRKLIELLNKE